MSFANVTTAGTITVSTTPTEHPNIATSGINSSKSVNRYWTLTQGDGLAFTSCNSTFTFTNPGDIDGGDNTNNFLVRRYTGASWAATTIGTRTSTTTQVTGLTSTGSFAIGEPIIGPWNNQTSGTTASLQSVSIVDDQVAWVCGFGGIARRTTNGGTTWLSNTSLASNAHNIFGVDASTALVCVNPPTGNDGRIYRTTDGGTTWNLVYQNTGTGAFMDAVHMFDPSNGVALGDPVGGQWILLKTSDGGATWSSLSSIIQNSGEAGFNNLFEWVGSQYGWIGTDKPWIYRTTDGGTSWSSVPVKILNSGNFSFLDQTTGMVSGLYNVNLTTNGGASWDSLYTFPGVYTYVSGIDVPAERWWLAQSNGLIQSSTNRGSSWSISQLGASPYWHIKMKKITAANVVVGYTVGSNGLISRYSEVFASSIIASAVGNGTITPSGTVHVPLGSNQTFTFTPNPGYHVDSVFVDGVYDASKSSYTFNSVTTGHTITVKYAINTYTLSITAVNGSVAKVPDQTTYNHGTSVQLTATPATGYYFIKWNGDTSGSVNPITITMNANKTITANFGKEFIADANTLLLLHFNNNCTGARGDLPNQNTGVTFEGGIMGQGAYFPTDNQLTFPSTNHIKSTTGTLEFWIKPRWNGNDGQNYTVLRFGVSGGMLFTKDGANNWRSIFNRYSSGGQPENGALTNVGGIFLANQWHHCAFTWSPNHLKLYIDGTLRDSVSVTITLPAINDLELQLGGDLWAGSSLNAVLDELRISDIERTPEEIVAASTANPLIKQYRIVATNGPHGSITPIDTLVINSGSAQKYTFTPNPGYHVDSVLIDGVKVDSTVNYTFVNVAADHTIKATFAINTYTLTVNATNGTVVKNPDQPTYNHGTSVQLSATPATDYHFMNWSDSASGTNPIVTITMNSNKIVTANFAIKTHTLSIIAVHGSVVKVPDQPTYNHGTSVQLTATPATGYHFVNWSDSASGTNPTVTITINNNKVVTANFAINEYTIETIAGAHGHINPAGLIALQYGKDTTFTFIPDILYHVDSVFIDGVYDTSKTSYAFRNVTTNHTISVSFALNLISSTYKLQYRWNMVSVPHKLRNYDKTAVFPTAGSANAFAYNGGYATEPVLENGMGYWINFDSAHSISITGGIVVAETIDVVEGWNLVGSISTPIPASNVTSDPSGMITSRFFGYSGSYVGTDSICPGGGYWVKVNGNGKLILSSSGSVIASNRIRIQPGNETPPSPPDRVVADNKQVPTEFSLHQNYPNPFNPSTVIRFQLPVDSRVTLRIYNTLGQEVVTLVNEIRDAGYIQAEWNAGNMPSGVYFYKVEATSISDPSKTFTQVRKMLLIR